MDKRLEVAAINGDVEFLRRAIASQPPDYFIATNNVQRHIFHIAALCSKVEFLRVALEILPITIQQKQTLLFQGDIDNRNPLHCAACIDSCNDSAEMVKLILDVYKSHPDSSSYNKPWLSVNIPLIVALFNSNEESAMEIMSIDMELQCNMVDTHGCSPLFRAVQKGCNKVAEKILASSFSYSLSGEHGSTPLHVAPNSSENILRLLLQKHPELADVVDINGYTILHQWAKTMKEVWPLDFLLRGKFTVVRTKVFTDFIYRLGNDDGNNPLHVAAKNENGEIGKAIINGYQTEIKAAGDSYDVPNPPWKTKNRIGNTPLQEALSYKNEQLALYILSLDPTIYQIFNNEDESPLLTAVQKGCGKFVEEILRNHHVSFSMLRAFHRSTVLHFLPNIPEDLGKKLLEKYWWMIDFANKDERTALDAARESNISWLTNLLKKPSLILQRKSFDWITKCEEDETHFVLDFIDYCKDLRQVCRELNDTPLHHIKLHSYEEYLNLLKKPSIAELKNTADYEGATPLHRALERKDMHFVKALLDDGVEHNIQDRHGKTAMDLLAELCEENNEWDMMCKEMNIVPHLNTTYVNPETNLDQMRNTLSVVAALLATITFAAGFTLPGGLDDKSGNAILAKKAAFLVFILADAYAMCMSMLVLFCLIWSMVSERKLSFILVDRSVLILMQGLYGTMVAFMTGIYTMIAHDSLWAVFIITVMCSFIVILANRTILHYILVKLLPAANKNLDKGLDKEKPIPSKNSTSSTREGNLTSERNHRLGDQNPLLEERKLFTMGNEVNQTPDGTSGEPPQISLSFARRNYAIPTENQDDQDQIRLLEEGHAFTSRSDDTKDEGASSIRLQKLGPKNSTSTSNAYKPSLDSQLSICVEQSHQQMSKQLLEFERQRVEFERQRVEFERQRLELETERLQREKEREGNKKVN